MHRRIVVGLAGLLTVGGGTAAFAAQGTGATGTTSGACVAAKTQAETATRQETAAEAQSRALEAAGSRNTKADLTAKLAGIQGRLDASQVAVDHPSCYSTSDVALAKTQVAYAKVRVADYRHRLGK